MEKTIIINYSNGTGEKPLQDFIKEEYEIIQTVTADGVPYYVIRDKAN